MKIDLLGAMAVLKENFECDSKMVITNESHGVGITIRVLSNGNMYGNGFFITSENIAVDRCNIFDLRLKNAIEEIKHRMPSP